MDKCFVCQESQLQMIRIFMHPKNLHFILKNLLGLQSKFTDVLCKDCFSELITAFENKKKFDQSNQERLESPRDNGAVSETSDVEIEQESEGKLERIVATLTSGTQTLVLLEQLETGLRAKSPKKKKITKEKIKRQYICGLCFKIFNTHRSIKRHILRSHSAEKPHVCNECGKGFLFPYELTNHKVHHTGEKPHICKDCPRALHRGLKQHCHVHANEKRLMCFECGEKFARWQDLKIHNRIHTGERPYECDYCPETFISFKEQKDHMLIHKKKKSFSCNGCSATFRSYWFLKNHKCIQSNEDLLESSEEQISSSQLLEGHKMLHTEETPLN